MSLIAMPDRAATKRAPDVLTDPPTAGEFVVPRTCRLTFAAPDSARPCAASRCVRNENGTAPEKSRDSAREPVSTEPPPLRPRPDPSPTLAWNCSLPPAKSPLEVTLIAPKPAERVCAVCAPFQSIE